MHKSDQNGGFGRETAETLALQALSWIAEDIDRLNGFMAMTGAAPADLANSAADAGFLIAVLDYLTSEDAMVVAFCDARGLTYLQPMTARAVLAGEAGRNWT